MSNRVRSVFVRPFYQREEAEQRRDQSCDSVPHWRRDQFHRWFA